MPIIFLFNFFGGLAWGSPGAWGPRFIEPPEPPVATPLPQNTGPVFCLLSKFYQIKTVCMQSVMLHYLHLLSHMYHCVCASLFLL